MSRKHLIARTEGRLTAEDWTEIYYAVAYKKTSPAVDGDSEFMAHLNRIMEKIGPDGENMTAKRSEPVDDCGCRLERTVDGLHMVDCPLHENAGDLLTACRAALNALNQIPNKKLNGAFKDSYAVCSHLDAMIAQAVPA